MASTAGWIWRIAYVGGDQSIHELFYRIG